MAGNGSRTRRALALLTLAFVATASMAAGSPPVADVHAGTLSGIHDPTTGLDEFKGVPYAAPPVDGLRWKPPQPVAAWQGVRKADHFGPRCMQRAIYGDMVFRSDGMSEDCLYLNVWTPALDTGKSLPVLVYFYGGGFIAGDGSEPRYDGASMAQRGIVTVTVNYRLGVFGFLALPALAAESPHHATGNYGLLDQAAALRWVKRNIAAFGGDPDRITIAGESAGSMSVSALMASPLSRDLMQQAIGESGSMLANLTPRPLARAEKQGKAFRQHLGADSLAQLRAMPADQLLAAAGGEGVAHFGPTIDGYFLPRPPAAIYEAGQQAHVPLLVGSNSQEGFYALMFDHETPTPANYRAVIEKQFGAHADQALKLYPGATLEQIKASGTALVGDEFIALATWSWMHWQRKTGEAPVYYYFFTQPRPAKRDGSAGPGTGAVHSGEIEYALGNLSGNHVYAWTDADRKVSSVMQGYFAHFIKTGNPNGRGLPYWPRAMQKHGGLLRQVIGTHTRAVISHKGARYRFLLKYYTGSWLD
ncbi:MAG TPA: carboxylesterase family protein [Oleiagrimonas sp.]|nr:carboxylesterase family protein [Oleiagrimonas sp.]